MARAKEQLMNKSSFDIIQAVVDAVRFVIAERRYMFACAVFPFAVTLVANMLSFFVLKSESQSTLAMIVLMLGAAAVDAWFMFLQTRLIVFGERLEAPPQDMGSRIQRHNDLRASVLIWVLFKLWLAVVVAYLAWSMRQEPTESLGIYTIIALLLVGAWIWSVRLAVAHILTAVGYSIKKYIFRVNGLMGSLRLIGLAIVVSLPFTVLGLPMEEKILLGHKELDTTQAAFLLTGMTALDTLMMVFLNAAAVFALKDMLSREDKRRGIKKV